MKTWLLLLLAAVFGGVRSQRACEQSWVGFEDSCYYASPYSEASVSWHSARAWCVANGGDLTSISTEEEQNFVMTLALSVDYVDFMWIGLNQLSDRVTLEWSDGTPVNYSNWLPTYPHNDQLHLCTYIRSAVTFKAPYTEASRKLSSAQVATWLTDNCGVEAGFVCKKPQNSTVGAPTPTPVVPGYCPTGYSGTGNKCFKVFRPVEGQLVTWPDALAICRAQPGRLPDLASITSEEEQNIIIAQLRDIEAGMWIGMHVWYDDYSKDWLWVDNSEKSYENWESSEPIYDEEAQCAEMATWEAGLWNNAPCSALRGYVCQTYKDENAVISTPQPTPFPCPDGYVAYWYACYKFVDTLVSWDVANQTCVSEGAQLVSIHSEPENSAIFTYAGNRLPKWIGFRQNAVSGDFVWTDGWAEHYTNWAYAEPYDGQCAIISREETWEAVPCVGTFGYICKIPEVTPTSPPYVEGSCPTANWVPWGSHCYYFTTYNEDVTTWNSAQAICTALAGRNFNGSVASITSEAENRFIYNSIVETGWTYSDAWIGLKQTSVGQPYYWVDGSPLTYTRWAAEEPSASPDTQCGMMHMADWPGHWYDQPCTENSYVQTVCKTPKGPVQT